MASRAAVLGGSQPHQLSPIDFEDKSGPDGPRNGDFLGHILWGTWEAPRICMSRCWRFFCQR